MGCSPVLTSLTRWYISLDFRDIETQAEDKGGAAKSQVRITASAVNRPDCEANVESHLPSINRSLYDARDGDMD